MPIPSRTGAQRWPPVTVGPTSGWETPRRRFHLSSPPKHKGSASSGPTNCTVLTTRASVRSLPDLRSTQATSRPLNSRIMPAARRRARRRARASGPSCGDRPSPAVAASFMYWLRYGRRSGPIISLFLLSCHLETHIPLALSLGAGCVLLLPLGNESSLTLGAP